MVEIYLLLDITIARRKVILEGSVQRGRRRVITLIDYLGLVNSLMNCLCLVKQLWWKTIESLEVLMVSSNIDDTKWIMDSECSFQMTHKRLWFQEFTEL